MNHERDEFLKSSESEQPARQSNDRGLAWAAQVLELDLPDEPNQNEVQADALSSFFRQLQNSEFYASEAETDAVEVVFGKSPQICGSFRRATEQEDLEAIDEVVDWYASQLGVIDPNSLWTQLINRLAPYNSQVTLSNVQKYADQVQLAAKVVKTDPNESDLLARELAQAVFHISAIRSSRRRSVRVRFVRSLQNKHSRNELKLAIIQLKAHYQLPNETFHQPFLKLLLWTEDRTEEFRLTKPVVSTTQSTVAYSDKFGLSESARITEQAGSETSWRWIVLVVILAGVLPAIGRFATTDTKPNSRPGRTTQTVPEFDFTEDSREMEALRFLLSGESNSTVTSPDQDESPDNPRSRNANQENSPNSKSGDGSHD